jgi:hypothetical protein
MFHLGGDVWVHLISTIPKPPYRSLIILDGDKRTTATEVVQKMKEYSSDFNRFELITNVGDITVALNTGKTVIYCLEQDKIEDYLNIPTDRYSSESYSKKIDGPQYADYLDQIPDELSTILMSAIEF